MVGGSHSLLRCCDARSHSNEPSAHVAKSASWVLAYRLFKLEEFGISKSSPVIEAHTLLFMVQLVQAGALKRRGTRKFDEHDSRQSLQRRMHEARKGALGLAPLAQNDTGRVQ